VKLLLLPVKLLMARKTRGGFKIFDASWPRREEDENIRFLTKHPVLDWRKKRGKGKPSSLQRVFNLFCYLLDGIWILPLGILLCISFTMASILSTPTTLGGIQIANRVIMAPLTRMRAGAGWVPSPLAAEYYSQRAGAGLVIVEATQVSRLGMGYPCTPGIYSAEQTAAWKDIVSAVHGKGGKAIMQLWHVGRISHSLHHPDEGLPVAPSAIAPADGKVFTPSFEQVDYETPREMSEEDIRSTIADYVTGAKNSLEAGFDGVEIHAANGYLLDQFLEDNTNKRTDKYGGSIENRMRFLCEVIEAVSTVYPSDKIGIRFSPYGLFNDMHESDPVGLFSAVFKRMNDFNLSYCT
jgi:N-ethylmaleimide reductase